MHQTQIVQLKISSIEYPGDLDIHPKMIEHLDEAGAIRTPILVRRLPTGKYEIIIRADWVHAANYLAWDSVPAMILDCTDEEVLWYRLTYCKPFVATDPWRYAKQLAKILEHTTLQDLAIRLNKPVQWIKDRLDSKPRDDVKPLIRSKSWHS